MNNNAIHIVKKGECVGTWIIYSQKNLSRAAIARLLNPAKSPAHKKPRKELCILKTQFSKNSLKKVCIHIYSILLTFLKNYRVFMPEEKNIIDELLKRGFTKSEIHSALHKFMMEEIKRRNEHQNIFTRMQKSIRKIKWKLTKIIQLSKKQ